jgi:hypothetical protein
MWRPHLWRFLWRVWAEVLSWHSATTFSLLRETFIIPLMLLVVGLYTLSRTVGEGWYKWSTLKTHGRDVVKSFSVTVLVLLALLVSVILAAIPIVVYEDHRDIVLANVRLVSTNAKLKQDLQAKVAPEPSTTRHKAKPVKAAEITESPCGGTPLKITKQERFRPMDDLYNRFPFGLRLVVLPLGKHGLSPHHMTFTFTIYADNVIEQTKIESEGVFIDTRLGHYAMFRADRELDEFHVTL